MHTLKHRMNRFRYYFKVLIWARQHTKRVSDYRFLLELKNQCHEKFLQAERVNNQTDMVKAEAQEKLLDKILNEIII